VRLFRYSTRTAIAVAAGLTQIGELSFVVVQVARSAGMVTENVFSATIAASLLSILLNVFLMRVAFRRLDGTAAGPKPVDLPDNVAQMSVVAAGCVIGQGRV